MCVCVFYSVLPCFAKAGWKTGKGMCKSTFIFCISKGMEFLHLDYLITINSKNSEASFFFRPISQISAKNLPKISKI